MHVTPLWQAPDVLQVVLAYLMAMEKTSVEAAFALLKQTYRLACPNAGVANTCCIVHYTHEVSAPVHDPMIDCCWRELSHQFSFSQCVCAVQASCNNCRCGMKCNMPSSLTIQATTQS